VGPQVWHAVMIGGPSSRDVRDDTVLTTTLI